MGNVIIQVNSAEDLKFLLELTNKLGFETFTVTDQDARLLKKQKLAEVIQEVDGTEELTLEEINEMVEQVRTKRYAKTH